MTGYTVHTGASKKFVAGWDNIFGGGKTNDSGDVSKPAAKSARAKKEVARGDANADLKSQKKKAGKASKKKKK